MSPSEYVIPLIVSNVVALVLLGVAIRWPRVARWLFAVIFIGAGLFNVYTASTEPQAYLTYAETAVLSLYRDFINGAFTANTTLFVSLIAVGQLTAGVLLAVGRRLPLLLGTLGASLFLAAIIPLGVGSGFPFSIIAIVALVLMYRKLTGSSARRSAPPAQTTSGDAPQAAK